MTTTTTTAVKWRAGFKPPNNNCQSSDENDQRASNHTDTARTTMVTPTAAQQQQRQQKAENMQLHHHRIFQDHFDDDGDTFSHLSPNNHLLLEIDAVDDMSSDHFETPSSSPVSIGTAGYSTIAVRLSMSCLLVVVVTVLVRRLFCTDSQWRHSLQDLLSAIVGFGRRLFGRKHDCNPSQTTTVVGTDSAVDEPQRLSKSKAKLIAPETVPRLTEEEEISTKEQSSRLCRDPSVGNRIESFNPERLKRHEQAATESTKEADGAVVSNKIPETVVFEECHRKVQIQQQSLVEEDAVSFVKALKATETVFEHHGVEKRLAETYVLQRHLSNIQERTRQEQEGRRLAVELRLRRYEHDTAERRHQETIDAVKRKPEVLQTVSQGMYACMHACMHACVCPVSLSMVV